MNYSNPFINLISAIGMEQNETESGVEGLPSFIDVHLHSQASIHTFRLQTQKLFLVDDILSITECLHSRDMHEI